MASTAPLRSTTAAGQRGRPYGGRAMAERVAERRARFIEAGLAVFGAQGLRGATVRGVCTAAGLTDRYFYESFDSLESLLQAVYLHLMARLHERLDALPAPPAGLGLWPTVEHQLRAGYTAWFDLVRDPLFARIVLAEVLGVSPAVDQLYEAATSAFADFTMLPVTLLQLQLSDTRRVLVGRALAGAAIQLGKMWAADGYRHPRDEVVASCLLVVLGTLRALAAESQAGRDAGPGDAPSLAAGAPTGRPAA